MSTGWTALQDEARVGRHLIARVMQSPASARGRGKYVYILDSDEHTTGAVVDHDQWVVWGETPAVVEAWLAAFGYEDVPVVARATVTQTY